jgi:hypothetical protein
MAALMSASGRMQTGRFGLMPIGSENVTTWWLADVTAQARINERSAC